MGFGLSSHLFWQRPWDTLGFGWICPVSLCKFMASSCPKRFLATLYSLITAQRQLWGDSLCNRKCTHASCLANAKGAGTFKGDTKWQNVQVFPGALREAPDKKMPGLFGHCPNGGGGGLDPCPNGLGHLFWEELFMFKGAFAWVWGVWTLARMVWGTYAVKIEVQMAFAQVGPEIKCPRVPVWVKGGVQSLFEQCPNRGLNIFNGASLTPSHLLMGLGMVCNMGNVHSFPGMASLTFTRDPSASI